MTISLDEFRARTKDSAPAQRRVLELQAAVREAARAKALTGDANWDHYLEEIETRIKTYQDIAAQDHAKLCDPKVVNVDEIMALKIKIACFNMAIAVLEEVMVLPKAIIAGGADAAAKLQAIDTPIE